jgi:NTE family protein
LVIGRGGTLGFAWSAVALREIERALDWDVRGSDVLVGTSAGSEMVAAIGSGRTPQDLLEVREGAPNADPLLAQHALRHPGMLPPRPAAALPGLGLMGPRLRRRSLHTGLAGPLSRGRGDATWLREFGDALAGGRGWVGHPATWIVAADIATGERVAFGAPGAPPARLGDALATSWAIPGWFPLVEIGGRRYVDGVTVSTASADLLLDRSLDEVIVVAPMATEGGAPARGFERVERLLCSQMTRMLDRGDRRAESGRRHRDPYRTTECGARGKGPELHGLNPPWGHHHRGPSSPTRGCHRRSHFGPVTRSRTWIARMGADRSPPGSAGRLRQ